MVDVDLASGTDTPTPPREPTLARVLDALRGLGERRAVLALLTAALAGTLVGGILTVAVSLFGGFVAVLGGLVIALSMAAGVHAAGLLQMDAERGIGQRSIVDALAQGLQALPMLIGVGLAVFAAVVAVLIAVALLLALTKIPFLGPLLFVVVFPVSIVAVGATVAGATVALAFAMGALWQGATPLRALAQTLVVLRRRTVPTLGRFVGLGFVVGATGSVVGGVLLLGFGPVVGLAASIIGADGLGGIAGGIVGAMQGGGGHGAAGAIGSLLLWAVALSLVAQVWVRGVCGVYLDMSEGVDAGASEARLRDKVEEARRRTSSATSTAPVAAGSAGSSGPSAAQGSSSLWFSSSPSTPPASAPRAPRSGVAGPPPWEESTSPSMTAASTLAAPDDFERLQRAAFGEPAGGEANAATAAVATPPRSAPMPSPTVTPSIPAASSAPSPASTSPFDAPRSDATPDRAAARATPPLPMTPMPPVHGAAEDDDTTLPPSTFAAMASTTATLPLRSPVPSPEAASATDVDLLLDVGESHDGPASRPASADGAPATVPASSFAASPAFSPSSSISPSSAESTPFAAAAPVAPPSLRPACPACTADIAPDDVFCNRCGQRVRAAP